MPLYDYACARCGALDERLVWPSQREDPQLCMCGTAMERVFTGRAPLMIPDSIPGGTVIENLTPVPKRYYSRTEIKDQMRVLGVESHVRHVGTQDGDRSRHTQRWI